MNARLPNLSFADKTRLLRHDLSSFIGVSFGVLTPGTEYQHSWHIDLIASKLAAFAAGEIKRMVIMLPPRSLKSHCASICLPAWILGHDPTRRIVCASYSQELADFLARGCRTLMLSPMYRHLFPGTQLSSSRSSVSEFMTTQQGMRLATSVGGTLTGKGGDFLIIDDSLKPSDALSDILRNGANEWYDSTAYPRLNDKANGGVLIIMQRLHEDDLVGHVLRHGGWEVVRLPAIAQEDEVHRFRTAFGLQEIIRREGEALHPERESLETLQQTKITQGEANFGGQYQQDPAPRGGGILKENWIATYQPHELPETFDHVLQSWDTASKVTQLADYSVCVTFGIKQGKIYVRDVERIKVDFPGLRNAAIRLAQQYKPRVILVEDRSSGIQLIQELPGHGIHTVKPWNPKGAKEIRFASITGLFEAGRVLLPEKAPWLADYIHELTTFPRGRHDDQVDATTQGLEWIQQYGFEPGIMTYYRLMYEENKRRGLC